MRLTINGEAREVPDEITLEALIHQLALAPERLAIERNREVVRRADWPHTLLAEDDRVEIIHFVGGGNEGKCEMGRSAAGDELKITSYHRRHCGPSRIFFPMRSGVKS